MQTRLRETVLTTNNDNFEKRVWEAFKFQAENCHVYRQYLSVLGVRPDKLISVQQIPFLPISFFKSYEVICEGMQPQKIFTSSGTTGTTPSRHPVADLSLYEESFSNGFQLFYGPVKDYCVLALLPSYLEREGSSLVYMAGALIQQSGHPNSGFYLYDFDTLAGVLKENESRGQKTLLLGVSFALLDFAAKHKLALKYTTIMETGGMKGRRKELTRAELHAELKEAFGVKNIHSEYGMTELLSQAYAVSDGKFTCPPWMRVWARTADDPFAYAAPGKTGGLNVIDLANLYSCSFIETEDLGKVYPDGSFEVLGRMDFSEVRGCNTMVE